MSYLLFIIFISFILLNLKISSKISTNNFSEIVISGFLIYCCSITFTGYSLSFFNFWNNVFLWSTFPFFSSYLIYTLFRKFEFIENRKSTFKLLGRNIQKIAEEVKHSSVYQKRLFQLLFFFNFIIICCVLTIFFVNPPNEWDSMTGHLNRILYFLQNRNTHYFVGTNWNIDTYPKSFPAHQVYSFLMMNKNEIWFKFHNISSYFITAFAFYGIMKRLGFEFQTRLIVSSLYLLIPISIIQSTTTDTDIVLACYVSILVYYILSYFDNFEKRYILLSALVFSIGLAHKITFVYSILPILLLIGILIWKNKNNNPFRHIKYILSSYLISLLVIVGPAGYLSNIIHYQHPIGPKIATQHQSVERAGNINSILVEGSRNILRYTFDILNPDGLRNLPEVEKINSKIKRIYSRVDKKLSLKLEDETNFTIIPFSFNRRDLFTNGTPIIGLQILFVILSIPILFIKSNRCNKSILIGLVVAFLLHLMAISFTAPYDPWKGRYMQSSFVFLLPLSGLIIEKILHKNSKIIFSLTFTILVLVGLSAFFTISLHQRTLLFGKNNIFHQSRMESLTISRPDITKAYRNFDLIVPQQAIVALATINDDYEYPLWGNKFSRKLIPINPFGKGLQPIPNECQYLFFTSKLIQPVKGDIDLMPNNQFNKALITVPGEHYYLRKLR
ncbi:MAG: hypothetical protein RI995_2041 [Bacteroidota bacterium]